MREAAEVEIVAVLHELVYCVAVGFVEAVFGDGLALVPPFHGRSEVLKLHRFGLGEIFVALGHVEAVKPSFFGWAGAVEEEDVGGDGGVGRKDAVRHADDGVEVELSEKFFLDGDFGVIGAEEEAVGQDDGAAAVLLETVHNESDEEIGGFAAAEIGREVLLDAVFFAAAVRRIHEDDVEAVGIGVVENVFLEAVAVGDAWVVDVVQEHVGGAEEERQGFFLDAVDGIAVGVAVVGGFDLGVEDFQGGGEEAAGAAGEIGDGFAELWREHLCHEIGDGARGVELPGVASALQAAQDGLVDFAKGVAVVVFVEVDLVDDVDDLAQENAILHVVVVVFEGGAHDDLVHRSVFVDLDGFEGWEEFVVDEVQKVVAGEGGPVFVVGGPVVPAEFVGDDGTVVVVVEFPGFFLGVVDFEEEDPDHLLDALGVAVDAGVVAHDVLQAFDKICEAHLVGSPCGFMRCRFGFSVPERRVRSQLCRQRAWRSLKGCRTGGTDRWQEFRGFRSRRCHRSCICRGGRRGLFVRDRNIGRDSHVCAHYWRARPW